MRFLFAPLFLTLMWSAAFAAEFRKVEISLEPMRARSAAACIRRLVERELKANHIIPQAPFRVRATSVGNRIRGLALPYQAMYLAQGRVLGKKHKISLSLLAELTTLRNGRTGCSVSEAPARPLFSAHVIQDGVESTDYWLMGTRFRGTPQDEPHRFEFIPDTAFNDRSGQGHLLETPEKPEKKAKIIAMMFVSRWCPDCAIGERMLQEIKAAYGNEFEVHLIDADLYLHDLIKQQRFIAHSAPSVTFYRNGQPFAWWKNIDRNLIPVAWMREQMNLQKFAPITTVTAADFSEKTANKWTLILIGDGYRESARQRSSVRSAQKKLKDRLVVLQMDSSRYFESGEFYRNQGLFISKWSRDRPTATVVLMKDGQVIARLENQRFKTSALTWLRAHGLK